MMRSLLTATVLMGAVALTACESTPKSTTQPSAAAMGMLNDACPLTGSPVSTSAPTVDYKGNKIGFCCAGCVGRWDTMAEADKAAFVAKQKK